MHYILSLSRNNKQKGENICCTLHLVAVFELMIRGLACQSAPHSLICMYGRPFVCENRVVLFLAANIVHKKAISEPLKGSEEGE